MRLLRISPRIVIVVFVVAASILGVLTHSFLQGGAWIAADQKLGLVVGPLLKGPADPPVFAYWISGTGGEGLKMLRLLKAVYHPRNRYLLHQDAGSSAVERSNLARSVQSERLFRAFRNVDVIGQSYAVDRTGPSVLAATLHGAAVLLRLNADWDWFITLSASDYPLVTQDGESLHLCFMLTTDLVPCRDIPQMPPDLLHVFASLPRNLNFIDHTSDLGWKEYARFDKIVVDPSLYMDKNSQLLVSSGTRKTPDAFKIFTGSPWVILSRAFVEHCIQGSDSLPRKLLMYFANVAYSMESYFQTVICNSPEFQNTTVNDDLRYIVWDNPPGLEPLFLNRSHFKAMVKSRAAFARKFMEDDPVLKKVDKRILKRAQSGVGFGQWCSSQPGNKKNKLKGDACLSWGDINVVKPGPSAARLKILVAELISQDKLHSDQWVEGDEKENKL
ncbi:Core-2/I-Branching enzyme [Musa troglodytarum]|uniref:Core-2/I-Branching enzyme n=1 Tax=Musa troglodytarum TaxID=320322 RepID=A0A9E7KIW6_9LILI|nr:Core-2/I-Branching enzyme [Musa troglodytarum]